MIWLEDAALDEIKAAVFVLTDRLAQGLQQLEAASGSLQAAVQELKQQQLTQSRAQEIVLPQEFLSLPEKLDAVIASQAKISSQLEGVAHACSQLPLQVEASAAIGVAAASAAKQAAEPLAAQPAVSGQQHIEAFKVAVDASLDEKLARLAELNAELLAQSRKNSGALEALAQKSGASTALDGGEEVRPHSEEQLSRVQKMLERVVENQNKQNEVLAEALGALLDAVSHIKARVDLLPTQTELEKDVEQDIAKKLGS